MTVSRDTCSHLHPHVVPRTISPITVTLSLKEHSPLSNEMKIALIIAHIRNDVVVLLGTLKVQSFMLTEVRDCDLLIVVTSPTFLKTKDMLKGKSS